ncbi:restriction endonuclease subunit S [Hyunsoonleella flava]|uniref:Restriction endonuclease subunit S n=1 Tax=Hyunsoonleella flava TaxID=2527939 RepID=A0A4Q9FBJ8_9FLAO|nr:restriction endonuclease subunit S [Hyunsoonleella flava]TBM99791.1 restriction endonuclease subunit S [Hyunsoonleella flava]
MPNNWKTYKLGDIAENVSRRFDFDKHQKVVFINTGDVLEGKFLHSEIKDGDGLPGQAKKAIKKGDILFSEIRPKNRRYALVDRDVDNYVVSTKFMVIVSDNSIVDQKYFLQLLTSNQKLAELQMIAEGRSGTFPQITFDAISHIEFNLPPLPEQKAIASILSAIDEKIENNLAINKTLEDMAMALYKHWFVDFGPFQDGEFIDSALGPIPKGWEVKRLDEVAFKFSKTFDFKEKDKVVFVNTGDVQNGSFLHSNYSEIDGLPGQAKKVIEPNDILYSEIRPKNKRYAYVDFDSSEYVVSTKFMIIRNNENINNRLLYRILTRQDTIDEFQMIAESRSGTFPQITFDVIGHLPMALPSIDIQNEFQNIVEPFEQRQSNNLKENQSLIQLRDTLLPKLIGGEVRLKEFKKQIETVL